MLELHDAGGDLERIETWLREQGFFAPGGERLVADLFLGYGLSEVIRRHTSPAPPEPCPILLAACAVRRERRTDCRNDNKVLHAKPTNAAELSNATGKTLDGGPITVYDAGAYAGEALVETLKTGDKRLSHPPA